MTKFHRGHTKAAKLTALKVLNLHKRYAAGATQGELARESGISIGQIGRILRGESWHHIYQQFLHPDAIADSEARFLASLDKPPRQITDDELKEIQLSVYRESTSRPSGREEVDAVDRFIAAAKAAKSGGSNDTPQTSREDTAPTNPQSPSSDDKL